MTTASLHRAATWVAPDKRLSSSPASLPEVACSRTGVKDTPRRLARSVTSLDSAKSRDILSLSPKPGSKTPRDRYDTSNRSDSALSSNATCTQSSSSSSDSRITPDKLCDYLKQQGLGDPRDRLNKKDEVLDLSLLRVLARKKKRMAKIPFISEKLKGQARIEYDMAVIKAVTFCDKQRHRIAEERRIQQDEQYKLLKEDESNVVKGTTEAADADAEAATAAEDAEANKVLDVSIDEELFERIKEWVTKTEEAIYPDRTVTQGAS